MRERLKRNSEKELSGIPKMRSMEYFYIKTVASNIFSYKSRIFVSGKKVEMCCL